MDNIELGRLGEATAVELLKSKGYEILQRNYRSRSGEIDIIAERYGEMSFIEVKTRQGFRFGRPCEAVDSRKKTHIRKAAGEFLADMKAEGYVPRCYDFQIIEISIEHTEHAF